MGVRSSYGSGRYTAGDADIAVLPKRWAGDGSKRGVIFVHGANDSCLQGWNPTVKPQTTALVAAIAGSGLPVLSVDAGSTGTSNQWANDTAMTKLDAAKTYLTGTIGAKADKVLLVGFSMGALTSLVWSSLHLSSVAALVGICPLSDLTEFRTNNRGGYQANVDAAYSGGYSEATYGATKNPATLAAAGQLAGLKAQLWYASDDTTVLPATVTSLAAAIGSSATATNVGALGHTDAAVGGVPTATVLAFLAANA